MGLPRRRMPSIRQFLLPINKKNIVRFLYINLYSIILACAGILVLAIPLHQISLWFLGAQIIIALGLISTAIKLFSAWDHKKREIALLVGRNNHEFRPETFEKFMQAPCGRLVVRQALADLGMQKEYKSLLKLKKPLLTNWREGCGPTKTVVYINEEAL